MGGEVFAIHHPIVEYYRIQKAMSKRNEMCHGELGFESIKRIALRSTSNTKSFHICDFHEQMVIKLAHESFKDFVGKMISNIKF